MAKPPADRRAVEAAVAALQEKLADGDPEDAELRRDCETGLQALRAAYRADRTLFPPEAIEALRELSELLRETGPSA
ncbi:MAG: hypothetical protein WC881_06770 [Elusimicrobiota bacterium]|jgi:hypothetical protein